MKHHSHMKTLKTSLLISTYNSPDYLRLCLKSILQQKRLPDEIVIADDGSGDATRKVIENFSNESSVAVKHIWHPDKGFRLSTIRNKAILATEHDYIIQIDGDIILHPLFVDDHIRFSKPGHFGGGARSYITPDYSNYILKNGTFEHTALRGNITKRHNGIRIPIATQLLKSLRHQNSHRILGCNMAYWRADAMDINGYNEDIVGWGREDSEFAVRLLNAGKRRLDLRFSAIEYHINHPTSDRQNFMTNDAILTNAITEKIRYIPNGIIKR